MNPALAIPAFGPLLPEIILAVGALVLVMFGAYPRRALRPASSTSLALVLLGRRASSRC